MEVCSSPKCRRPFIRLANETYTRCNRCRERSKTKPWSACKTRGCKTHAQDFDGDGQSRCGLCLSRCVEGHLRCAEYGCHAPPERVSCTGYCFDHERRQRSRELTELEHRIALQAADGVIDERVLMANADRLLQYRLRLALRRMLKDRTIVAAGPFCYRLTAVSREAAA